MSDMPEHLGRDLDPTDAYEQRLFGLIQQLDRLAGVINPDYAEEVGDGMHLEDGSAAMISSTDLGDTLRTEICFNASRVREQLGGVVSSELFPGKEIAAQFIMRGTVTQDLSGIAAFPDEIQREARESPHFEGELDDSSTKYGVMVEQEFTIATDGEFERKLYLIYLINDIMFSHNNLLEVHADTDVELDIPFSDDPSDDVVGGFSFTDLADVFSATELADLQGWSQSLIEQNAGRQVCDRVRDQAATLRFVGRMQQLDMVARLITQFDGSAAAA